MGSVFKARSDYSWLFLSDSPKGIRRNKVSYRDGPASENSVTVNNKGWKYEFILTFFFN